MRYSHRSFKRSCSIFICSLKNQPGARLRAGTPVFWTSGPTGRELSQRWAGWGVGYCVGRIMLELAGGLGAHEPCPSCLTCVCRFCVCVRACTPVEVCASRRALLGYFHRPAKACRADQRRTIKNPHPTRAGHVSPRVKVCMCVFKEGEREMYLCTYLSL